MKDDKDQREGGAGGLAKNPDKIGAKGPRQDRLKLALRENLKRRKTQARARSDVTAPSDRGSLDDNEPGE